MCKPAGPIVLNWPNAILGRLRTRRLPGDPEYDVAGYRQSLDLINAPHPRPIVPGGAGCHLARRNLLPELLAVTHELEPDQGTGADQFGLAPLDVPQRMRDADHHQAWTGRIQDLDFGLGAE